MIHSIPGMAATQAHAYVTNAERGGFASTVKRECLDHFLAFGMRHLDYLVTEFVAHYHAERPHQGVGNRLLPEPGCRVSRGRSPSKRSKPPPDLLPVGRVTCHQRLGGVLRHYERSAA